MNHALDWVIMLVAGSIIAVWIYRRFYSWLHEPPAHRVFLLGEGSEVEENDETVKYLERSGYVVTSGKHRIPIHIRLDDERLQSRLYIDYTARKNGELYIVRTARDRSPVDWTGSGLRDRLLVYALLVPEAAGVLFVDAKQQSIRKIAFAVGETAEED